MIRISMLTIASLALLAAPAMADTDQGDWLSKAFGGSSSAKSSGKTAKSQASITSSGGNSVGGGVASYYWQPQKVASGGTFNPNALTAAHKTLPFGTRVRVTSTSSGRSVDVVINDRGPFVKGRVIDLSRRAAQDIGMTGAGLANVRLQVL
jgi:rare lipoprotein A